MEGLSSSAKLRSTTAYAQVGPTRVAARMNALSVGYEGCWELMASIIWLSSSKIKISASSARGSV
eukprot:scaffold65599_cov18-Tisochrysis_lutea.AAC.1